MVLWESFGKAFLLIKENINEPRSLVHFHIRRRGVGGGEKDAIYKRGANWNSGRFWEKYLSKSEQ